MGDMKIEFETEHAKAAIQTCEKNDDATWYDNENVEHDTIQNIKIKSLYISSKLDDASVQKISKIKDLRIGDIVDMKYEIIIRSGGYSLTGIGW